MDVIEKKVKFLKDFDFVDKAKIKLLNDFSSILTNLNENVNLISRKDVYFILEHHILHSLFIGKIFKFCDNETIIDVGTGGGFPGIPLAICYNKSNFTLLDSINKKIKAIDLIIEKLNLTNVETICDRSENLKNKYDVVLGRGVKQINTFYNLTKHLLKKNGKILYLNGCEDKLIYDKNLKINYYNISNFTDIEFYKNKQIVEISLL